MRLIVPRLAALAALALSSGSSAHAADPADPGDLSRLSLEELMSVEVASVYGASRFDQKTTDAPASVTVVTAADITRYGWRTLGEVLASERSFYVTSDRAYQFVGVRGYGLAGDFNTRILLLLDGHRFNDNVYDLAPAGTDFAVDLANVERIEVIRGSSSSLYGSNAFFAVVNVVTRSGGEAQHGEVAVESGSPAQGRGRVTAWRRTEGGVDAYLSASYGASEGVRSIYYPELDTAATNRGVSSGLDGERGYRAFAKLSGLGFTFTGVASSRAKDFPGAPYLSDFNTKPTRVTDTRYFGDLRFEHALGDRADVTARAFVDASDFVGDMVYAGILNRDYAYGRWWGADTMVKARLPARNLLSAGAEFRDNFRQTQGNFDVTPYNRYLALAATSSVVGVYAQDEWTIVDAVVVNVGVRHDQYSTFGGTTNPRAALVVKPFQGTVLKALYGQAFRAPNVYERLYQSPGYKANPDLGPEKIRSYELVWEQAAGRAVRLTAAAFLENIRDLITQTADPADGLLVFRNVGRVDARGVEGAIETRFAGDVRARASYTLSDAQDRDTRMRLTDSPAHLVKVNASAPLVGELLVLALEGQYVADRKTRAGTWTDPVYLVHANLSSTGLVRGLTLSAGVRNLLDHRYVDPASPDWVSVTIPQDGLQLRAAATYRF
jgi:iron complex outermembrane receptor protein